MIKKVLISIGIIIVIAGITVGVLSFIKHPLKTPATQTLVSKKLVLDHSKDYGACTLIDISTIKTNLGDAVTSLQAPVDAGITSDRYFGDSVKDVTSDTQTCVYAFAAGGSTDEALIGINGLTIKQTKFTNTEGPNAVIKQMKQNPTATSISELGDAAFYTEDTQAKGPNATFSFTLIVFKNKESTSYSIIQLASTSIFTPERAKTALLGLANK